MRLLVVEDERSLARAVTVILEKNHYSVDTVYDGRAALDYLESGNYDGVILDLMLPLVDGITVLNRMRQRGDQTPVLILSAKSEIEDKVTGLDSGANDYLTKPFSTPELLARIRAMTRKWTGQTDSRLRAGNVVLDQTTYQLSTPYGSTALANREYQLMELLMANFGQLIPTDRLLERIWGYESEAESNVIWVYISNLRKKLTALNADVRIRATRNVGYSLELAEE